MTKKPALIASSLLFIFTGTFAFADVDVPQTQTESAHFRPFTGKIRGNRVRLRSGPDLDSTIVSQLSDGELYIIQGETDEFYSVKPKPGTKAYVHRKFVLDGEIDGQRVNVRLQPSVDSPIVGTLNTGDKIQGVARGKWLEIETPPETRFYVYKDYIENMGGPEIYLKLEKQRERYQDVLTEAKETIDQQFHRPFENIEIDETLGKLNEIIGDQKRFPEYAAEAKQLIHSASERYLQKKIAYLENLTENPENVWVRNESPHEPEPEKPAAKTPEVTVRAEAEPIRLNSPEMLYWEPLEAALYEQWANRRDGIANFETFYAEEDRRARLLEGVLKEAPQTAHNTPGDYVLVNERTKRPIAYLYSTKVNLREVLGRKVTVRGVERPNNHFAFPAYFVLNASQ